MNDNAANAVNAWRDTLGTGAVLTDDATLTRYGRTSQDTAPRPIAVLFPRCTDDVVNVVRIATTHKVPVYPISGGKNWGYGDACPSAEQTAIVDLSQMNHIVEVNTDLAYAVIEAGVTQGQLAQHLSETGANLWVDCTGAGPNSSLVGNTLDRGFGHTVNGDHFLTCCGMEVVLADGTVVNTGFGHFDNAKSSHVYRYGVGPFLDGLFGQANFGIVTRVGLWLVPKPQKLTFFYVQLERDAQLPELINRLRPLRLDGTLRTAIHIGNDLRMLSGRTTYPWDDMNGAVPLSDDVRAMLRKRHALTAWSAGGALFGTRAQVRASKKALRNVLGGFARPKFIDDAKLVLAERVVRILQKFGLGRTLRESLDALRPVYGLLKGQPSDEFLLGAQWRLRKPGTVPSEAKNERRRDCPHSPQTTDPLTLGAGLMWISPVVPMTGHDAQAVLDIVTPIFAKHGFDLPVTFTMINERAMIAIMNVAFDKREKEETMAAMACYDESVATLLAAGYVPYRTGLRGFAKLFNKQDSFWATACKLKSALDPEEIIAPGRYIL